jgi:streptogramin lyase
MHRPSLLLAAVSVVALSACTGTAAKEAAPHVDRSTTPTGSFVKTGSGPVGLTVDSRGRVWVASANAGTISRLNARGDRVEVRAHVGAAPLRLAATAGGVWVSVFSDGLLRRVNAVTGRVTKTVKVGAEPEGLTAAFGSLWVVLQASADLVRLDPKSGQVDGRYPVGAGPRLVTAGHGALWVSDFETGRIFRVDPGSGNVRHSSPLCEGPQGMAFSAGTLWVACTTDNVLVGLDSATLSRTHRLALAGSPDSIAAGLRGRLLVALQKGPTLATVDPAGPSVERRATLGRADQLYDSANIDAVYARGHAWVTSYREGGVYRVTGP